MYLDILKKDLKRKKVMNIILLIFIILSTMFITSSGNNILSITTALDEYIKETGISDYFMLIYDAEGSEEQVRTILDNEEVVTDYKLNKLIYGSKKNIEVNNEEIGYANLILLGRLEEIQYKVFYKDDTIVTNINDGEIYLSMDFLNAYNLEAGDSITVKNGRGYEKKFIIAGGVKSIIYGNPLMGATMYLISDNDYSEIMEQEGFDYVFNCGIISEEVKEVAAVFGNSNIITWFEWSKSDISAMYLMDMVIAGVMLIVSICLILISIVILRFTIVFTLNEEFREIGIMKAIGIKSIQIRMLYSVKYFGLSLVGAIVGSLLSFPFGKLLLNEVSKNMIINGSDNGWINILGAGLVVMVIVTFCFLVTGKLKKVTPISAIRNGSNGERYYGRNMLRLNKSQLKSIPFLALNDIFSGLKRFLALMLTFTIGMLLITIPLNTTNTLKSDKIVNWFGMTESDLYLVKHLQTEDSDIMVKDDYQNILVRLEQELLNEGIEAVVFVETQWNKKLVIGDGSINTTTSQGLGISTEEYRYTEGVAPQSDNEIAMTHVLAQNIGVNIGDTVRIVMNETEQEFIITATFQTMMNMGRGIRFSENLVLDYTTLLGNLAIQVKYLDEPNKIEQARRMEFIKELYPDAEVFQGGEYIAQMINISLDSLIYLIVVVVICINALVAVLMMKSFIAKEKGEIAMLKAIGFRNNDLIKWQMLRIGLIMVISTILGAVLSIPLAQISAGQVFKMMGASSITFEIKPLEVYIIYPCITLATTMCSSFIAAQDIRRISASKTNEIE